MSYNGIPAKYMRDNTERLPTNCYWLDTIFWGFSWKFREEKLNTCVMSGRLKISELDDSFYFQVYKASETSINVEFHRKVDKEQKAKPDDGYVLNFHFSIVGLQQPPINEYMTSNDKFVKVTILIDPEKLHEDFDEEKGWVVKCYCEMCEISDLDNELYRIYNSMLKEDIKAMDTKTLKNYVTMAAMMKRENLDSFVSGRQSKDFVYTRHALIERTMLYATDIMFGLSNLDPGDFYGRCSLASRLLNCIYKGKFTRIEDEELVVLFAQSYRYGLRYLQILCKNQIMRSVRGIGGIIYALKVCVLVCHHSDLTDYLEDQYFRRRAEIESHKRWKNLEEYEKCVAKSITDTCLRISREPKHSWILTNTLERMEFNLVRYTLFRTEELRKQIEKSKTKTEPERETKKEPQKKSQKKRNRRKKK